MYFHPPGSPKYLRASTRTLLSTYGCIVVGKASRKRFLSREGSKCAVFMDTPSVTEMSPLLDCTYVPMKLQWIIVAHLLTSHPSLQYRMACCRAMADAHEVDGISLLLNVETRDEEEAIDAIAAGAVGRPDNIEGERAHFCCVELAGALDVGRKQNPLRDEWGN